MGFNGMGGGIAGIAPHLTQQRVARHHRTAGAGEEDQHRRLLLGEAQAKPGAGHFAGVGIEAEAADGDENTRRRLFEAAQQVAEAEGLGQTVIGTQRAGRLGGEAEQQQGLGAALAAQIGAERSGLGGACVEQQKVGFRGAIGEGIAPRQQLLAQGTFDGVVAAVQKNTLGHGL